MAPGRSALRQRWFGAVWRGWASDRRAPGRGGARRVARRPGARSVLSHADHGRGPRPRHGRRDRQGALEERVLDHGRRRRDALTFFAIFAILGLAGPGALAVAAVLGLQAFSVPLILLAAGVALIVTVAGAQQEPAFEERRRKAA